MQFIQVFLFFLVFLLNQNPVAFSADQKTEAKIVGQLGMVSGVVLVNSVQVEKGVPIREGAVIEVKKESRATLLLGKGSVFHLGAESKMVVTAYGVKAETRDEEASLDLQFGRTRALILNQGPKRELKIRSRAATMGVRGTEVLIDSPQAPDQPVRFFTLEGLAEVKLNDQSAPVALPQNQSLVMIPQSGPEGGASPVAPVAQAIAPQEMKEALNSAGLPPPPPPAPDAPPPPGPRPPGSNRGVIGGMAEGFGAGMVPPIQLDPLLDRRLLPEIRPQFCNGVTGNCP